MTDDVVERLASALGTREPQRMAPNGKRQAAVAAVLRMGAAGAELLLIRRTARAGDPWSGHLAFPGGRIDRTDSGPRAAAERETEEEVGVDLARHTYLGQLDDITGATIPVIVAGFVYVLTGAVTLSRNAEVAEAYWVALSTLCDSGRHSHRLFAIRGDAHEYPCVDLDLPGAPVLWGLTYRFCRQISDRAGVCFGPGS